MPALTAAVIQLEDDLPAHSTRRNEYNGSVRTWWLAHVKSVKPELMPHFVSDEGQPPAYTVSPLLRADNGRPYIRITALTDVVSAGVTSDLLPALPPVLTIGERTYSIIQVTTDSREHPDAGITTYPALVAAARQEDNYHSYTFALRSPLAFRVRGIDFPLPDPAHFYESLLRRWELYSSAEMLVPMSDFFRERIAVTRLHLHTASFTGAYSAIGCVGVIGFSLLRGRIGSTDNALLQHQIHIIHALSQFAFYAGVGIKVTHGMGQVRLLHDG